MDTVNTIAAAGEAEITIYTDGSAENGYKNGGSAAVVTSGPANDPVKITSITRKGRRLTSSYEKEVTAMLLAVGCIKNSDNQGPFIMHRQPVNSDIPTVERRVRPSRDPPNPELAVIYGSTETSGRTAKPEQQQQLQTKSQQQRMVV